MHPLILASEVSGSVWSEYLSLLTDWPHYMFEATFEILVGIILIPFWKFLWYRGLKKHDMEHHSN